MYDALLEAVEELRRLQEIELNEFRDAYVGSIKASPETYKNCTKKDFKQFWKRDWNEY